MTALSFHEIGLRWPDAVVYWDRDVAPTLDWEPRFVERDGVLWAVPDAGIRWLCHSQCRCLVWDGERWISHGAWDKLQIAKQLTGPVWSSDPEFAVTRVDELVEDYRVRLGLQPWADRADAAREMSRSYERITGRSVDHGRRSGRTTHGLLRAIARCTLSGERELLIVGPDRVVTANSVHRARELLYGLGIDGITVRAVGSRPRSGRVNYRDHHLDER